jgi:hypothetical protein
MGQEPLPGFGRITGYTDVGLNRKMRQNDPRHIQRHYFRIADDPEVRAVRPESICFAPIEFP